MRIRERYLRQKHVIVDHPGKSRNRYFNVILTIFQIALINLAYLIQSFLGFRNFKEFLLLGVWRKVMVDVLAILNLSRGLNHNSLNLSIFQQV